MRPSDLAFSPRRRWLDYSRRLLLSTIGVLMLLGIKTAPATALVENVMFTARADGQGYVVRVRTADTIKAYGMPRSADDQTIEWVLYNTALHENYEKSPPRGPIQNYSTTSRNGHLILRLEVDPNRSIKPQAYRDGASNDLLLNLSYEGGGVPVADAQQASSSGVVKNVSTSPPPSNGASEAARERWKLDTVVIDAGHGGKDPGATANGLYEKDIVLDVAHKLGDYVENRLGVNVVYTRTGDRFIPLEERGHMANEAGAKLFISLHVNASRQQRAHGTETYFLGPSKTDAAET